MFWWSIFDGTNIHVIYLKKDLYIDVSCVMITYPISSNFCKNISLQCYRLYDFSSFGSSHWRCSVRKSILRYFVNFTGKQLKKSLLIKLQAEATASDFSRIFPWRFLVYIISTEKWNEKRKIPWWNSDIYVFARLSICLTLKISKEIWQFVIWSENVFKGNLMLQFSWSEEFR